MWVYERPDAGRGFGFTGGHKHVNWADDNCRKVVLNALLWIAKADVPADGVPSTVAPEELAQNLDPKNDSASFATNITGKWNFEVETPQGTGKPVLSFIHAGQNLIGHYQGRLGEANLSGSVKGNSAQWSFKVEFDGQPAAVTYKATLDGKDRMKGTVALGEIDPEPVEAPGFDDAEPKIGLGGFGPLLRGRIAGHALAPGAVPPNC